MVAHSTPWSPEPRGSPISQQRRSLRRILASATTTFAVLGGVSGELAIQGDPVCWEDGVPPEYCCGEDYGETGTPSCWVMGFRYTRCCGVKKKKAYTPAARRSVKLSTPCDFIVVGAGSGGATVASRLETAYRVCIVEVTNDDKNQWTAGYPVGPKNWKYTFGQGIGGSTLVNSGVYTRGNLEDYEEWGGDEFWGQNRTKELFKTLEAPEAVPGFDVDYEWHPHRRAPGTKPSKVSLISAEKHELPPVFRAVVNAWEKEGLGPYRVDPHSKPDMEGIGGTWRFSGCDGDMDAACSPQRVARWRYIGHEREHQSVDQLLTKPKIYLGTVSKVLLGQDPSSGETIAKGVEFIDSKGQVFQLSAHKEVILAAGVVNTPKILMLSGVGDPLELSALNIPVVQDLPHVGLHLQDHYGFSSTVTTNLACPKEAHRDEHGSPKGGTHLGFLNDFLAQFYAWYRLPESRVTFEMFLIEGCLDERYTLTFTILLVSPSNEGRIILDSADPMQQARMEIFPHVHEEDLNYLSYALRILYVKVFPALRQWDATITPDVGTMSDEGKAKAWIKENLYYYSHPSGTARYDQARPEESVVNADLTVQGIPNLRICDASVFGKAVIGHTDGPTRMVGANCAKIIMDQNRAEMPYSGYGTNTGLRGFHIAYYLQAGGRLIDTALTYENQAVVAVGIQQSKVPREEVFLVTKVGPEHFDDVYSAVKEDLTKYHGTTKHGEPARVTYFDLVLLHWPNLYSSDLKRPKCASEGWTHCRRLAWQGLEKLVQDGVTRFIGVSNFDIKHLAPLVDWDQRKYPVYANQIEYGIFRTPDWEAVKQYCDSKAIRVMAFGVIGGLKSEMLVKHPSLVKAAEAMGTSPQNVMFQWAMDQGVTVLQGSKRKKHMDQFIALSPSSFGANSTAMSTKLYELPLIEEIPTEERTKCYEPDPVNFE
ncbi:unnamed protein product [Amoebophrya sp. A25]|nr:unnamed protein product [Amoebophrya sp. A25]|eukprot:GSA25T00025519001.1